MPLLLEHRAAPAWWQPAARWFLGLSVGRKLLLIYLLDLSAVVFVSSILIREKYIAIDFSRKEAQGVAYIDALRPSLLALADPGAQPHDSVTVQQAARAAEQQHGAGMATAGTSVAWINQLAMAGPSTVAVRTELMRSGLDLLTEVVNRSNLILDPELGSYYTMSLTMLRYPQLLKLSVQLARQVRLADGPVAQTAAERAQLQVLEGELNALVRAAVQDLRQATDAHSHAVRASTEKFSALQQSIEGLRQQVAGITAGGPVDRGQFDTNQRALLVAVDAAWRAGNRDLSVMLQGRVDDHFSRMAQHLSTALLLMSVILAAVFLVARRITVPLARLAAVADTVRQTGDHRLRLRWDSGDEIGRLVRAFNDMLAQLDEQRQAQQELAASARAAEAQQMLLEQTPVAMVVTAVPDQQVLHANPMAGQWLCGERGDPWARGMSRDARRRFFQTLSDTGKVSEFEVLWRHDSGDRWALLSACRLRYQGRDAVLTTFTPIARLKLAEQRLALWAKVFEASSEGIAVLDGDRRILSINHALATAGAVDAEGVASLNGMLLDQQPLALAHEAWHEAERRGWWRGEVQVHRPDRPSLPAWVVITAVRNRGGALTHFILTCLDISERKAAEEHVRYLAHHDVLTGLPNRAVAERRLHEATALSGSTGQQVAVLFVDLDRFKNINDSMGHQVGDDVLRLVAQRLTQAVRESDTVSRFGGDEFVILLNGISGSSEAHATAQRVMAGLRQPYAVQAMELSVSCSVGIAMFPTDGQTMGELMRNADAAMYHAKASGRDKVFFFTSELNRRVLSRMKLEQLLRNAIARNELRLMFQPQVDARSGALLGVEALLRWKNPELGVVSPAEFIPLAEESGQIIAIGEWVIDEACRCMAQWRTQGVVVPLVSINLSVVQLMSETLLPALGAAMERHRIDPAVLELELTESTLMDHSADRLDRLFQLKALGLRLSLDDFGTGYSSLSYLSRLPMDKLKIDRSLVKDMLQEPKDRVITEAVVALAHRLDMCVVAEGVESAELMGALAVAGCDAIQGYHTGRPMSAAALAAWMPTRPPDHATAALAA